MLAQAELIDEALATLTAMSWLALGTDMEHWPDAGQRELHESPAESTLRERIAQQYAAPFDAIFDSQQAAAELGDVDRSVAVAVLLGPLVLGKLSTLAGFDYRRCAQTALWTGFWLPIPVNNRSLGAATRRSACHSGFDDLLDSAPAAAAFRTGAACLRDRLRRARTVGHHIGHRLARDAIAQTDIHRVDPISSPRRCA